MGVLKQWNGFNWEPVVGKTRAPIQQNFIRVATATNQVIPNNEDPYPVHSIIMDSIELRSSTSWDIDINGAVVIPYGITCVSALGNVYWTNNATGDRQIVITKNGAVYNGAYFKALGPDFIQCSAMLDVAAGDLIQLGVRQYSGGGTLAIDFANLSVFSFATATTIYGNGDPPEPIGIPDGTIYIKYT